jgi:hypothetical protein
VLTALVIGGAENVIDEAQEALRLWGSGEPDAIAVTNDTIPRWSGRADYLISLHPDKLGHWIRSREQNGHPMGGQVWSYRNNHGARGTLKHPGVEKVIDDWAGSSGLFACRVLIAERFQRIVVAGVPMEPNAGHIVRRERWSAAKGFQRGWEKRFPQIKDHVRSMSGWTAKLLGYPSSEWVRGE